MEIRGSKRLPDLWGGLGGPEPGFWLQRINASFPALYVALAASSERQSMTPSMPALAHGGKANGLPGDGPQFNTKLYAANVLDTDG